MSSWTEALVEDIGDLPAQMARNLHELREADKATRLHNTELTKQEADFLEEVKAIIKEHGSNFDEGIFQQRAGELTRQRQELSSRLDEQLNRAKRAYEVLDKRIIAFDEKTKGVKSLYAYLGTEMDGDARNKKKKRKSRGGEETEVQMNEPVYCFCRAVQYGDMVACDHPDCELEWFHYACVNIKVQVNFCGDTPPPFVIFTHHANVQHLTRITLSYYTAHGQVVLFSMPEAHGPGSCRRGR